MIHRAFFTLLLTCLLATVAWGADELRGKFVLAVMPKEGPVMPEVMDFMADGSCVLDIAGRTGVKATFQTDKDSKLTIKILALPCIYYYCLQKKYTLTFCQPDGTEYVYVRPPAAPHPEFKDLVGIVFAHSDLGDAATEITADHKFRLRMHYFVPGEQSYNDVSVDGTCTYSDGIITYWVEHDNSPEKSKYLRDFVVKCDEKGMSIIDPFHDNVLLEPPAKNLDLPEPPKGYKLKP